MQSEDIYEAQDVDDMSGEATGEFDNGTPSEEELQSIVGSALDDAVDFIDNTISPLRATSIDYYQGKPFGNEEAQVNCGRFEIDLLYRSTTDSR